MCFFFAILRKLRLISLKQFKEQALIGLKNKSMTDIRNTGTIFFKTHLKETLRKKALRRIEKHKKSGDMVFIVSASPDIYVHAVSRYLDCDGYLCSELAFCSDYFSGRMKGEDCIGREKQRRISELSVKYQIDLKSSYAYSDHEADIPFLEAAGTRTAVSPSPKLCRIADARGWEVEYW